MNSQNATPEYNAWKAMRKRCLNPKCKNWKDYGGRGIGICSRWESFNAFLEDMGKKPSGDLSIERKNNSMGYSPKNCVWATRSAQSLNRRFGMKLTIDGLTMRARYWCVIFGINYNTFGDRIRRRGCTPEQALMIPVKPHSVRNPLIRGSNT
jgi:hypothetical protein